MAAKKRRTRAGETPKVFFRRLIKENKRMMDALSRM